MDLEAPSEPFPSLLAGGARTHFRECRISERLREKGVGAESSAAGTTGFYP